MCAYMYTGMYKQTPDRGAYFQRAAWGRGEGGFHSICVEEYYFDSAVVIVFSFILLCPPATPPPPLVPGRADAGEQRSYCSALGFKLDFSKFRTETKQVSPRRSFLLWGFLRKKRFVEK